MFKKLSVVVLGLTVGVMVASAAAAQSATQEAKDKTKAAAQKTAEVVTDGGEKRQGKVTFVASTAEFTPKNVQTRDERVKLVYRVKIGLDNADGLFKPGMPAEARF